MKRVDVLIPDNIANNVEIYKQAEEITTWSRAILKLVDLGLRYYCNKDREEQQTQLSDIRKKMDHIEILNLKLMSFIEDFIVANQTNSSLEEEPK